MISWDPDEFRRLFFHSEDIVFSLHNAIEEKRVEASETSTQGALQLRAVKTGTSIKKALWLSLIWYVFLTSSRYILEFPLPREAETVLIDRGEAGCSGCLHFVFLIEQNSS